MRSRELASLVNYLQTCTAKSFALIRICSAIDALKTEANLTEMSRAEFIQDAITRIQNNRLSCMEPDLMLESLSDCLRAMSGSAIP